VKGELVTRLEALLAPGRFVGGHPIAGRERAGVAAAVPDLFADAICILTPTARTDAAALTAVTELWEGLGARVERLDPAAHDRILAAVSHLPHVVAYALVAAALDLEQADPGLLTYSAGGFRDFSRIAASSPEMWRDICLANRAQLLDVIGRFEAALARLKNAIAAADGAGLLREFEAARAVRARLPAKNGP
jgi:prephenate dehydrogenase